MTTRHDMLTKLTKDLIEQGRLMEAGWVGLRLNYISPDAPQIQLDEMRFAFFAGAQHLFGSITNVLDPEADVTDADMKRMESVYLELHEFVEELQKKAKVHDGVKRD